MTLHLVHSRPQTDAERQHCEAIGDCTAVAFHVAGCYDKRLADIMKPVYSFPRKVAVAVCSALQIPTDAICEAFNLAVPTQPLLWSLEISLERGANSEFRSTFDMMLGSCRSATRKHDPQTRRMEAMPGDGFQGDAA